MNDTLSDDTTRHAYWTEQMELGETFADLLKAAN
jgi:hypothetical protein